MMCTYAYIWINDTYANWMIFLHSFQLLKSVNPQFLKLTAIDDEIYRTFRQAFPDTRLDVLDLEEMKSAEGKKVSWLDLDK